VRHGFSGAGRRVLGHLRGAQLRQGSTDQAEAVTINRARVARAMGVPPEALVGVHQIHSADVVTVEGPRPAPRADAMVTRVPGLALSILTADCQPALFATRRPGSSARPMRAGRGP
jgi:copper oxidase (laccase) domain-containing protein